MQKSWLRGSLMVIATFLGLISGGLVGSGRMANAVNHETVAYAAGTTSILQSQFDSDVAAVRDAVRVSCPWIRGEESIGAINDVRDNGVSAYDPGDQGSSTFAGVIATYSDSLNNESSRTEYNQDLQGIMALYRQFEARLSAADVATLQQDIVDTNELEDWDDKATDMSCFADDLQAALNNYTSDVARLVDDVTPVSVVTPAPIATPTQATSPFKKMSARTVYHRNARKISFLHSRKGAKVTLKNRHHQKVVTFKVAHSGTYTVKLSKKQAKKLSRGGKYFTYTVTQAHHKTYTQKFTIK